MITSKFEEADTVSKLNVGVRSHIDELLHVYVKIMLDNDELLPSYATEESACMDIRSNEDIIIKPGHTCLVSTGIHTEIPKGYVALVFPRSGLSIKQGGSLANCVGVIDSDYRGEWKIGLFNHNPKKLFSRKNQIKIVKGDRIAQFLILRIPKIHLIEANILNETDRGEGGFGSTGNK